MEQLKLPFESDRGYTVGTVLFVDQWDMRWVLYPDGTIKREEDYYEDMEL